jgi:hypothetical protein
MISIISYYGRLTLRKQPRLRKARDKNSQRTTYISAYIVNAMKAIKLGRTTNNHWNNLLTEAFLSQINQSYSHKHNSIKHTRRST